MAEPRATMPAVVLASGSPRRRELLTRIGMRFRVAASDIDESVHADEDPADYVRRLACEKAEAIGIAADELVIAADTTVVVDGEILGKPIDADDARRMLHALSGRDHVVLTGLAVCHRGRVEVDVVTTIVTMVDITESLLDWYVGTGEPMDKAGAYAIQGAAAVLVAGVDGSVSNVVGLPLAVLAELIERHGISFPGLLLAR